MNTQRHDSIAYQIRVAFCTSIMSRVRYEFAECAEMAGYCLDRQPLAPAGSTVRSGGYDRPCDLVFCLEPDSTTL